MFLSAYPNLYTQDMELALRFYRDLLGFEVSFRFPEAGKIEHVELRLSSSIIAVSTYAAAADAGVAAPTPGHPFELVVWAEDVDQAVARLRATGVPVVVEPEDVVAGNRRAYVEDPDGNWLTIVSKRKPA